MQQLGHNKDDERLVMRTGPATAGGARDHYYLHEELYSVAGLARANGGMRGKETEAMQKRLAVLLLVLGGIGLACAGYYSTKERRTNPPLFTECYFLGSHLNVNYDRQHNWLLYDHARNMTLLIAAGRSFSRGCAVPVRTACQAQIDLDNGRQVSIPVKENAVFVLKEDDKEPSVYRAPVGYSRAITMALDLDQWPESVPESIPDAMVSACESCKSEVDALLGAVRPIHDRQHRTETKTHD